jgi:hypothetical protein
MSKPAQTINIIYSSKSLNLVDCHTLEHLYKVKVDRHAPQVEMRRLQDTQSQTDDTLLENNLPWANRVCTATFKLTSLQVRLSIHEHEDVPFTRDQIFSTKYTFASPFFESAILTWKADGALSGNYMLTDDAKGTVLARFRNKLFSVTEVGTLEITEDFEANFKDEIVISALAMLVMVQSLQLGVMVIV